MLNKTIIEIMTILIILGKGKLTYNPLLKVRFTEERDSRPNVEPQYEWRNIRQKMLHYMGSKHKDLISKEKLSFKTGRGTSFRVRLEGGGEGEAGAATVRRDAERWGVPKKDSVAIS